MCCTMLRLAFVWGSFKTVATRNNGATAKWLLSNLNNPRTSQAHSILEYKNSAQPILFLPTKIESIAELNGKMLFSKLAIVYKIYGEIRLNSKRRWWYHSFLFVQPETCNRFEELMTLAYERQVSWKRIAEIKFSPIINFKIVMTAVKTTE